MQRSTNNAEDYLNTNEIYFCGRGRSPKSQLQHTADQHSARIIDCLKEFFSTPQCPYFFQQAHHVCVWIQM